MPGSAKRLSAELLESPTTEQLRTLISEPVLLVHGPKALLARASRVLQQVAEDNTGNASEGMDSLIEALMPTAEVPEPVVVLQARRNAALRESLLREFGALTAEQVHELAGSTAENRSALAGKWRKEGAIFAVEHRGKLYYPAFQFGEEGRPLPVITDVLNIFGKDEPGWQTALWFLGANGWLGGKRPIDLVKTDPERVVRAAAAEVASVE